jgi:glycosyltransferase involved in cell wall biosynthesis
MKIWLVTIGEPIFHPDNKLRLHRTGILAKYIAENTADEVVWWTSTFSHFTKEHLYDADTEVQVLPRFKMIAIKGKGYKRNISIDRIIDHAQIAKKFTELIKNQVRPDIIVAAFPTMGLCKASLEYGKENNIPVIIDYRDMWPEVYVDVIPGKLQFIGKFILQPLFKELASLFSRAYGMIGITQDFLNLALNKIPRVQKSADGVFPLGYLLKQYAPGDMQEAGLFWDSILDLHSNRLRICFFGAIGYQSNWNTISEAATRIQETRMNVELVICGSGDKLDDLKEAASGNDHIIFPGFVSAAQIRSLMEHADIGLCAYFPKESYMNSVPGKAIEYMSAGLPLLSTLEGGTLGHLIDEHQIGFHYRHDSVDSFLDAVNRIMVSRDDLKITGDRIKKVYNEYFDAGYVYKNYAAHLDTIVKEYTVNR